MAQLAEVPQRFKPPAVNTRPSERSVRKPPALMSSKVHIRGSCMLPVRVQVPVAGSKTSAEASEAKGLTPKPPATSTRPSRSRTAARASRATFMSPVRVHAPVEGSKISAALRTLPQRSPPPATSTLPSARRTATALLRFTLRLPVRVQAAVAGS
jgi:hypothetical protein